MGFSAICHQKNGSMKLYIILLFAIFPEFGQSQKSEQTSRKVYETAPELNLIDTITWEKIKEDFSFGNGRVAYVFKLDSTNTFKYIEFGDVATITLDHGTWKIRNNNILFLKSRKKKYYFDVIKFGKFLFYINRRQRLEFVTDFKREQIEVATYEIDSNELRYTKEHFVAFHLMKKYYGTEFIQ